MPRRPRRRPSRWRCRDRPAPRAGASLMPSPTIATTCAVRLEHGDEGCLVRRASLGADPVRRDADLCRNGLRGGWPVAGQEPDLDARVRQGAYGSRGLRLDRVTDGDETGGNTVDRDVDGRSAGMRGLGRSACQRRRVDAVLAHQPCVADEDRSHPPCVVRDEARHSSTGDRREIGHRTETELVLAGAGEDGRAQADARCPFRGRRPRRAPRRRTSPAPASRSRRPAGQGSACPSCP